MSKHHKSDMSPSASQSHRTDPHNDAQTIPNIVEPRVHHTPARHLLQWNTVTQLFYTLLCLCAMAIGGWFWIRQQVSSRVDAELRPYETSVFALQLTRNGLHDEALREYETSFNYFRKHLDTEADASRLDIIVTGYLDSLASCDKPSSHIFTFRRLLKLYDDNSLASQCKTDFSIGYFFLRTGDVESAHKYFQRAIQPRSRDEMNRLVWDNWKAFMYDNLFYLRLAQGDIQQAYSNTVYAAELNPKYGQLPGNVENALWFIELKSLYPKFYPSFTKYCESYTRTATYRTTVQYSEKHAPKDAQPTTR